MRAYSVSVVARAMGVDRRWVDNVVTLHRIDGVRRERQGVSRAISPLAVMTMTIALDLSTALGSPIGAALEVARHLVVTGEHTFDSGVIVQVDLTNIERRLASRLAEAVETHPPARRGRPPQTR